MTSHYVQPQQGSGKVSALVCIDADLSSFCKIWSGICGARQLNVRLGDRYPEAGRQEE